MIRTVQLFVNSNQYYFRIDHEFRPQDKVFVRLAADRPSAVTGNINPNFPRFTVAPATNLATQYIHLFSPRTLSEFRYGVNKASPIYSSPRSNTNFDLNSLGIGTFLVSGTRPLKPYETGIPSTLIGGDSDNGGLNINHATEHEFSENLSFTRGSHGLKAGFDFRRLLTWQATSNNPRGILGSASAEGGYALAGWLMGYLDNSTTPEGLPPSALNQNRCAAYFMDDWKVSRKLTVNLGLRWDFFQVPVDALGGVRSLRLDVLSQASDGRLLPTLVPAPFTQNYPLTSSDNRYFMPRAGLAYRVTDKWIVRTGAGWFARNNWGTWQSWQDSLLTAALLASTLLRMWRASSRIHMPGRAIVCRRGNSHPEQPY